MTPRTRRQIGLAAAALCISILPGCRVFKNNIDSSVMTERLESAPPVMHSTMNNRIMLVMQAPNPGWSISIDRDEREEGGWIVFITINKPDPAFMYPQRIVEKSILTNLDADQTYRVMARMLEHDEKGDKDDYAPLSLVESFEP